jgi:hypothetical protein
MNLPPAVFVGFFPKLTQPAPEWLGNPAVREICSVSTCISAGPEGWLQHWRHNRFGFYDSEALALEVAGPDPASFDLYAYKLFPFHCLDDQLKLAAIVGVAGPLPPGYEFLGYDIVTKSTADFFECSPLSCNAGARQYDVNKFCLIAAKARAYQVLLEISRDGGYEPGPYYLFEVYRKPHLET